MSTSRSIGRILFLFGLYLLFALVFTAAGANVFVTNIPPLNSLTSKLFAGVLCLVDLFYSLFVFVSTIGALNGRVDEDTLGRRVAFGVFGLTIINISWMFVLPNVFFD